MLFIPIATTRRAVRERQAESAGFPTGFESPDVVPTPIEDPDDVAHESLSDAASQPKVGVLEKLQRIERSVGTPFGKI